MALIKEFLVEEPILELEPRDTLAVQIVGSSLGGDGDVALFEDLAHGLLAKPKIKSRATVIKGCRDVPQTFPTETDVVVYNYPADIEVAVRHLETPPILIQVLEHGCEPVRSDLLTGKLVITTGFEFDPAATGTIQSGIHFSPDLQHILDVTREKRVVVADDFSTQFRAAYGFDLDLAASHLSIYYNSLAVDKRLAYFTLLSAAQNQLDKKLFIVAPIVSESSAIDLKNLGINFISPHINDYDPARPITVFKTGHMPRKLFLQSLALADSPCVITGDQSLNEAAQKAIYGESVPFLYNCVFGDKTGAYFDFMQGINPYVAEFLASYYRYDAPGNTQGVSHFERRQNAGFSPTELAKVFYDSSIIEQFNTAQAKILDKLVEMRNTCVARPDILAQTDATLQHVLESVRVGDLSTVKDLMV